MPPQHGRSSSSTARLLERSARRLDAYDANSPEARLLERRSAPRGLSGTPRSKPPTAAHDELSSMLDRLYSVSPRGSRRVPKPKPSALVTDQAYGSQFSARNIHPRLSSTGTAGPGRTGSSYSRAARQGAYGASAAKRLDLTSQTRTTSPTSPRSSVAARALLQKDSGRTTHATAVSRPYSLYSPAATDSDASVSPSRRPYSPTQRVASRTASPPAWARVATRSVQSLESPTVSPQEQSQPQMQRESDAGGLQHGRVGGADQAEVDAQEEQTGERATHATRSSPSTVTSVSQAASPVKSGEASGRSSIGAGIGSEQEGLPHAADAKTERAKASSAASHSRAAAAAEHTLQLKLQQTLSSSSPFKLEAAADQVVAAGTEKVQQRLLQQSLSSQSPYMLVEAADLPCESRTTMSDSSPLQSEKNSSTIPSEANLIDHHKIEQALGSSLAKPAVVVDGTEGVQRRQRSVTFSDVDGRDTAGTTTALMRTLELVLESNRTLGEQVSQFMTEQQQLASRIGQLEVLVSNLANSKTSNFGDEMPHIRESVPQQQPPAHSPRPSSQSESSTTQDASDACTEPTEEDTELEIPKADVAESSTSAAEMIIPSASPPAALNLALRVSNFPSCLGPDKVAKLSGGTFVVDADEPTVCGRSHYSNGQGGHLYYFEYGAFGGQWLLNTDFTPRKPGADAGYETDADETALLGKCWWNVCDGVGWTKSELQVTEFSQPSATSSSSAGTPIAPRSPLAVSRSDTACNLDLAYWEFRSD